MAFGILLETNKALVCNGGDAIDNGGRPQVEEARPPAGGERPSLDPGTHARDGVATVLDDRGDVPDVLGPGDRVAGCLGRLVGVERTLVVGVGAGIQVVPAHLVVELLEVDTEGGDVLEGQLLDGGELVLAPLELPRSVATHRSDRDGTHRSQDQQQQDHVHDASLRRPSKPRAW